MSSWQDKVKATNNKAEALFTTRRLLEAIENMELDCDAEVYDTLLDIAARLGAAAAAEGGWSTRSTF